MRSDDVIDIDAGPRVPKMYRLAVEYISESQNIPMSRVYQDALDAYLADFDWTKKELHDYYGRRADDINHHMTVMRQRGIGARREATKARNRDRRAA